MSLKILCLRQGDSVLVECKCQLLQTRTKGGIHVGRPSGEGSHRLRSFPLFLLLYADLRDDRDIRYGSVLCLTYRLLVVYESCPLSERIADRRFMRCDGEPAFILQ